MKRLVSGRLPPSLPGLDRYHFPVTPTLNLQSSTREGLHERIFEYRLRNNIPVGDIEADVNQYYCFKWPSFCHDDKAVGNPRKPPGESMLNRVSRWVQNAVHANNMPRGGWPLENSAEAERRAAICAGCPKNIKWVGGCSPCAASTKQLLQQVKQLKKTKYDGSLMACSVGSWECGASAWLPAAALPITPEQKEELVPNCWRTNL